MGDTLSAAPRSTTSQVSPIRAADPAGAGDCAWTSRLTGTKPIRPRVTRTATRPQPSTIRLRQRSSQSAQDRSDDRGVPVQFQQVYDPPSRFGLGSGLVASDSPAAVGVYRHTAPGACHEAATAAPAIGVGQSHPDTAILHGGRHRPSAESEFDRTGEGHFAVAVGAGLVLGAAPARRLRPLCRFGLLCRVRGGGGRCGRFGVTGTWGGSGAGGGRGSGGVRARPRGIGG